MLTISVDNAGKRVTSCQIVHLQQTIFPPPYLEVELPEPLGLVNVLLLLAVRERAPLLAEVLGDLRVVGVRVLLDDFPPLQLGPAHEGVHRTLHVVLFVLSGLK